MEKYLQGYYGLVKTFVQNVYYYQDELGSTSHIADGTGSLIESYQYDVYGKPRVYNASGVYQAGATPVANFLQGGARWMPELGLYDDRNRFMSPDLGRFIQPDPIGFKGDASNLYRYCGNDWANKTDPMGLEVGFGESLIPVWGSAHEAYDNYQNGQYRWMAFNAAMAITDVSGAKALLTMAGKVGLKAVGKTALKAGEKGLERAAEKKAVQTGYRYVGQAEKTAIENNGMKIPKVDPAGKPKNVYYTNERFTGGAEAKEALSLPNKPEFRVEFNMQQAPAGTGGLTGGSHAEFTLKEGTEPIKASSIEQLHIDPLQTDSVGFHDPLNGSQMGNELKHE